MLELAHRLDRDTSGLLVVAKKRSALVELHRMLREGEVEKLYVALVQGRAGAEARSRSASAAAQVRHRQGRAAGQRARRAARRPSPG